MSSSEEAAATAVQPIESVSHGLGLTKSSNEEESQEEFVHFLN